MAASSLPRALSLTLGHEGGYADDPRDPGGATNHGITRATLAAHRGRPVTKAEVRALTLAEAGQILERGYWRAVQGDALPRGPDLAVFDLAVNAGPRRAALILQRALRVAEDGVIGPATLAAAARADPAALVAEVSRLRLDHLRALPTWPVFGRGWSRRVAAIAREATALAASSPANPEEPTVNLPAPLLASAKPLLSSRTLWANLVGLGALALDAAGFDAGDLAPGPVVDAGFQLVAALSFLASTAFRILATRRLAG